MPPVSCSNIRTHVTILTHTPVSTPPSPKLTCVLLMVYHCDCFVEVALCTPLFAEGLSAWAMNKMRTQHSQVNKGVALYKQLAGDKPISRRPLRKVHP